MYTKAQYYLDKAYRSNLEAEMQSAFDSGDRLSAAGYMERILEMDNKIMAAEKWFIDGIALVA